MLTNHVNHQYPTLLPMTPPETAWSLLDLLGPPGIWKAMPLRGGDELVVKDLGSRQLERMRKQDLGMIMAIFKELAYLSEPNG